MIELSRNPCETFRALKETEAAKFGEHRTRRLVPEAWGGEKQERESVRHGRSRGSWRGRRSLAQDQLANVHPPVNYANLVNHNHLLLSSSPFVFQRCR